MNNARKAKANHLHETLSTLKVETLYEDAIVSIVGNDGLLLLREFHLIETCALLNGRKLYAL